MWLIFIHIDVIGTEDKQCTVEMQNSFGAPAGNIGTKPQAGAGSPTAGKSLLLRHKQNEGATIAGLTLKRDGARTEQSVSNKGRQQECLAIGMVFTRHVMALKTLTTRGHNVREGVWAKEKWSLPAQKIRQNIWCTQVTSAEGKNEDTTQLQGNE